MYIVNSSEIINILFQREGSQKLVSELKNCLDSFRVSPNVQTLVLGGIVLKEDHFVYLEILYTKNKGKNYFITTNNALLTMLLCEQLN